MSNGQGTLTFAVCGYAICSSMMLICNKIAVHVMPAPNFVLFAQLASSAVSVWMCGVLGFIEVDALAIDKVIGFLPVAFAFLGVIYANIKTLQFANVETFIVFRASTPIAVSICDYLFLGRAWPDAKSWFALFGLFSGTIGFVFSDSQVVVSEDITHLISLG